MLCERCCVPNVVFQDLDGRGEDGESPGLGRVVEDDPGGRPAVEGGLPEGLVQAAHQHLAECYLVIITLAN